MRRNRHSRFAAGFVVLISLLAGATLLSRCHSEHNHTPSPPKTLN